MLRILLYVVFSYMLVANNVLSCAAEHEEVTPTIAPLLSTETQHEEEQPQRKLTTEDTRVKNHRYKVITDSDTIVIDSLLSDSLSTDSLVTDSIPADSLNTKQKIRILSIGNSYAQDAFSYVPFILNELKPDLDLTFCIMYYPGRPLADHWSAYTEHRQEYQRHTYTTQSGRWATETNRELSPEVDSLEWDLIIFQQASGDSPKYETYQPWLHLLTFMVHQQWPSTDIGWLLTPAHAEGYAKIPAESSDTMWKLICDSYTQLVEEEKIDVFLPCGTAIQNARYTPLDSLGVFGHLTYEGLHLQEGIPSLIEAYVAAQVLANKYHWSININNSQLRPTQQWVTQKGIPGRQGVALEGEESDYNLCKKIAHQAIQRPFTLWQRADKTPIIPITEIATE